MTSVRPHRDRGVRRADARAREGQGASNRSAGCATAPTTPRRSGGSTSPAGTRCSNATSATVPARFRMPRNPGSGPSRGSRRSCRPASPPMSRRRETRSASISPTFAASCAPPSTPTGRCAICSGRLATAARGCGRAAGVLAPAAIATLPKWMRRTGNFDQPAAVDAAVAPVAQAMVRALSAGNSRPLLAVARRPPRETRRRRSAEGVARDLTSPYHARSSQFGGGS
jgi:hypothetical protein